MEGEEVEEEEVGEGESEHQPTQGAEGGRVDTDSQNNKHSLVFVSGTEEVDFSLPEKLRRLSDEVKNTLGRPIRDKKGSVYTSMYTTTIRLFESLTYTHTHTPFYAQTQEKGVLDILHGWSTASAAADREPRPAEQGGQWWGKGATSH